MKPKLKAFCEALQTKIQETYAADVTMAEAQNLAGEFLDAQMQISDALKSADLDARMRKSGLKAIRGAVYNEIVGKAEKKPTVDSLEHSLNMDEIIVSAQNELDVAETERDDLKRYYDIFHECHIYYRGIGKGSFG